MNLTAGLNIAKSGLAVLARETAVISRNVAQAGDAFASRKTVQTVSGDGGVTLVIGRATDASLFDRLLSATATAAQKSAVVDALDLLNQTVGDPADERSPAALTGTLRDALQTYSEAPGDVVRAQSVVSAARDLAFALKDATTAVQTVRAEADAGIASSVARINSLLADFASINQQVVNGARSGDDITSELDRRDLILASLSEEIGIRTVTRAGNDMAIYTDSGVTLFERQPRTVSFTPIALFDATTEGQAVFADGVRITGAGAVMPATSGRIAGLSAIRDQIAPACQSQLDELARGLVEAFAETDQSAAPSGAPQPGLFTFAGAAGVPPSGTVVAGLAGRIEVAARVDPAQGGDALLLRDGDISGAGTAYVYNTTAAAGYSARIRELASGMSEARSFDPAAQLQTSGALTDYASSSAAWLQELRRAASSEAENNSALKQRASDALSAATGVNLDAEMARLLELERAYQASSRIITTIDAMYSALFQALR